jgi:hypothetical protein
MVEQAVAPQPYQEPKRRSPIGLIIAAIAAVVVVIVVVVVLWLLGVFSGGGVPVTPQAMPDKVGFFATARVDIEGLAGFKHLSEIYRDIPEFDDQWDEMLDSFEDQTGMNFDEDIKPWLGGEVAVGLTDLESAIGGSYGTQPGVVIVLTSRNNKAADEFLVKFRDYMEEENDYNFSEEEYDRVTYYYAEPESEWDRPPVFGRINNYVVITTDQDMMEDTIDAVHGKRDSLAEDKEYSRVLQALPRGAVAYAVYPDFGDTMRQGVESSYTELPAEAADQIEAIQGMGMAVSLDKEGVKVDIVVTFDPKKLSDEALKLMQSRRGDERILEYVPADALGFFSGYDLGTTWRNAYATLEQDEDFAQQLEDLGDQLGMTIDGELLSWTTGGFALAIVEAQGDIPIGGYGVLSVSDQEEADKVVNDLADALAEQSNVEFDTEDFNDVELQVVRDPYTDELVAGYGFFDKVLLVAYGEDAMNLATDRGEAVTKNKNFQRVRAHLPQSNGYLYINVESALQFALDQMDGYTRDSFEESTLPYLEPIKGIGMAGGATDTRNGVSRATVYIYIP